jgi:hypothetical protein
MLMSRAAHDGRRLMLVSLATLGGCSLMLMLCCTALR